jgi:hypothetical protein
MYLSYDLAYPSLRYQRVIGCPAASCTVVKRSRDNRRADFKTRLPASDDPFKL